MILRMPLIYASTLKQKKMGNQTNRLPIVSVAKIYLALHSISLWMIGARMISIA